MSLQGSCLSHPIRSDVRGTAATIASRDTIVAESIQAILETWKGERVMLPDYGIDRDLVFAVVDFGFVARFAYQAERAIKDYEPMAAQVKVTAGEQTDEGFRAGLAQGRVALSVSYTVRGSNLPRNLVFPVWQLAN